MKKNVKLVLIGLAVTAVLYYIATKFLFKSEASAPVDGGGTTPTPEPEENSGGIIDTIQDVFGLGDTETVEVIDEVEEETTTTTEPPPPPPPPAPTCELMSASIIAQLNSNDSYKNLNCIASEGYTTLWGDGNWESGGQGFPSTLNSSHCGRKLASLQQILNSSSANGGCIPVADYGKATPLTLQKWNAAISAAY